MSCSTHNKCLGFFIFACIAGAVTFGFIFSYNMDENINLEQIMPRNQSATMYRVACHLSAMNINIRSTESVDVYLKGVNGTYTEYLWVTYVNWPDKLPDGTEVVVTNPGKEEATVTISGFAICEGLHYLFIMLGFTICLVILLTYTLIYNCCTAQRRRKGYTDIESSSSLSDYF